MPTEPFPPPHLRLQALTKNVKVQIPTKSSLNQTVSDCRHVFKAFSREQRAFKGKSRFSSSLGRHCRLLVLGSSREVPFLGPLFLSQAPDPVLGLKPQQSVSTVPSTSRGVASGGCRRLNYVAFPLTPCHNSWPSGLEEHLGFSFSCPEKNHSLLQDKGSPPQPQPPPRAVVLSHSECFAHTA